MAIEAAPAAAPAASNSNVPTPKASSGHGKTVGIAVGVTIGVIVIAVIFIVFYLRLRKRSAATAAATAKPSQSHQSLATAQEKTSAKELNAKENEILELDGPDQRRNVQANSSRPLSPWVTEKGSYSGHGSEMVELTGDRDQNASEPSQSEPLLGPVPEMYGSPPAAPVELPADSLNELPDSSVTRNVSSAGSSSFHRRSRGFFQSRSSTPGFLPSPASAASPPNPLADGPPDSNRSTTSSPPMNEVFSPISPIADGGDSTSHGRLISLFRGSSQRGRASQGASDDRQASHGNV